MCVCVHVCVCVCVKLVLTEGALNSKSCFKVCLALPPPPGHPVRRDTNVSGVGSTHYRVTHCERGSARGGHQRVVPICQLVRGACAQCGGYPANNFCLLPVHISEPVSTISEIIAFQTVKGSAIW